MGFKVFILSRIKFWTSVSKNESPWLKKWVIWIVNQNKSRWILWYNLPQKAEKLTLLNQLSLDQKSPIKINNYYNFWCVNVKKRKNYNKLDKKGLKRTIIWLFKMYSIRYCNESAGLIWPNLVPEFQNYYWILLNNIFQLKWIAQAY